MANTRLRPAYKDPDYLDEPDRVMQMKIFKGGSTNCENVVMTVRLLAEDHYKYRSIIFHSNNTGISAFVMGRTLFLGDLVIEDGEYSGEFEFIDQDPTNFVKSNLRRKEQG